MLGEIIDAESILNELGRIVLDVWRGLPSRYDNVETDAFVVMPNHLHGIIIITSVGAVPFGSEPLFEPEPQSRRQGRRRRPSPTEHPKMR